MKKFTRLFIVCSLIAFMPFLSFAHPGHGDTEGYSIIHYIKEPVHAVITLGVLIFAIVVIRSLQKKKA